MKKPRTKIATMQKKKLLGGTAYQNIILYYQAALLEAMLQWWNEESKGSWELEQEGIEIPFTKWVLSTKDQQMPQTMNLIVTTLCRFWKKKHVSLSPGISPSFGILVSR